MDFDPAHIFVVVAVIIAAIRGWLEKRQAAQQERELLDDINERVERRQQQRRQAPRPDAPPSQPQPTGSFGDLYEEFRREILERQQRPVTPSAPPPLPRAATPPPEPEAGPAAPALSAAEEAALQRLRQGSVRVFPSTKHQRNRNRERLFQSRGDLRRAFILKEVLDPPKALQSELPPSAGVVR